MALAGALTLCMIRLGLARLSGPLTPDRRALWLQSACRGVIASLGIHFRVQGHVPSRGLVVSNHLSYLDILIYSSAMPCVFVSKIEVNQWPYFGRAARAGGTLFIDRSSRASAAAVATQMVDRLRHQVPVLVFPEGTSTDGTQVLKFHSTLFQPAVVAAAPVTPAAVRYIIEGGVPESELCWFGDAPFLGHLWKALDTPGFSAVIRFGEPATYPDRRTAASETHKQVAVMRESAAPCTDHPHASPVLAGRPLAGE